MHTLVPASALHVQTSLNYLMYEGTRPQVFMSRAPGSNAQTTIKQIPVSVRIHDARGERVAPSLDKHGFELVKQPSARLDFSDDASIRDIYYAECEALLKQATGAEKVVVFDHAKRLDAEQPEGAAAPVRGVHCDQTFVSGPRRVRDHLSPEEAEQRLKARCAIINVWRPIAEPVLTAPLALCDATSIELDDIVATDFVYPDNVGEVALFRPNPNHRWFYYPQMKRDEAILIKIYDSLEDGTARLSAHSAFDDPTSPAGAPPRQSIEVRALVFWPA
jgi:hypothetical protein